MFFFYLSSTVGEHIRGWPQFHSPQNCSIIVLIEMRTLSIFKYKHWLLCRYNCSLVFNKICLTVTNITPKEWLRYLRKQFSSWMCLPFKCQYKQLDETSQPKPHNCSQYLEFRMACHVWKGWEGFVRFGGALVNSTDCLAVLDGFVGSAVTNLYFCNTYLCCFMWR